MKHVTAHKRIETEADELALYVEQFCAVLPPIEQFIDDPYYLGLGDRCCDAVRQTAIKLFGPHSCYS